MYEKFNYQPCRASPEEWLNARRELLEAEKALTYQSDRVAKMRKALLWVKVNKAYEFDTVEGKKSLKDLFCGRCTVGA